MNPELSGMSNEELIQWTCINAPITEEDMRCVFPDIDAFCAQNPVELPDFIGALVRCTRLGITSLYEAIEVIKCICV